MPSSTLLQSVVRFLSANAAEGHYLHHQTVAGGDINEAFKITTSHSSFFVKYNAAPKAFDMLQKEAMGLELLRSSKAVSIPSVVGTGKAGDIAFLVLEYIDKQYFGTEFMFDFGQKIAKLHQCTQPRFGLDFNNYIGSLEQSNLQHNAWEEFFILQRIVPQLKIARNGGKISKRSTLAFDALFVRLPDFFTNEPPALLHGDLWAGNYLCGKNETAYLIDPAVYYGHREMDIAMTQLFGGFSARFYEGYQSIYPLEKGWKERTDVANLYPLLVHVNLFGGGYVDTVDKIVRKFA
jgi:fructosamine-3-kinase